MGRFSCFYPHMRYHKSKKAVQQPTTESMHKTSEDFSQDKAPKFSAIHTSLEPLVMDTHDGNPSKNSADQVVDSSSNECYWKSEEINSSSSLEDNMEINERGHLNKSKSLGSGLNKENRVSSAIDSETEQGDGFSSDEPQERNYDTSVDDSDRSGLEEQFDSNNPGIDLLIEYNETFIAESFQDNDVPDHTGVTFRIGDQEQADDFEKHSSDDHAGGFGHRKLVIEKSFSVPNFEDSSPKSGDEYHAVTDQESDAKMLTRAKDKCESSFNDGFDYYKYSDVEKNWTTPEPDKVGKVKTSASWNELPSNDFKIKRITEWVNTIDLDNENSLHEIGETSHLIGKGKKGPHDTGHAANAKLDAKSPIEVAKNYISSLTPASTSAQMVNLGLVVIPFLSAFVSLRVLNLSGNSIVRITAGALPRGLHALNLSKNNISTIEGLRELTRLRVLDLSYNRISRIGHGLASCSSLKELYLAGNKISEVEGLHRLLKLHILDLRFNKISTSKCLGQLAANYSSLQDIRLEGNPAQRNVGDEQLKKYLQSLLPHLVSYNKHTVRAISSKEIADRPVRAAISTAHQFGPRSDNKLPRKGIPSGPTSKVSSSSTRIAHAVSSLKQMKGRSAHLATGGTKESRHRHRDLGEKLLSIQTKLSMHRSRSEGNLGGG